MIPTNGFAFHARHTHDTPNFRFELDEYRKPKEGSNADAFDQMLLAHLSIRRFSKEVLQELLGQWLLLRAVVRCPIFASPKDADDKWVRFVTALGFRPLQKILCNDGVARPLFIHTV